MMGRGKKDRDGRRREEVIQRRQEIGEPREEKEIMVRGGRCGGGGGHMIERE